MAEKVFSEGVVLPDGRKVRILAYDDDSVRFRIDGTPYALAEAFLQGGTNEHAILKLTPLVQPAKTEHGYPCPHEGCDTVAKTTNGLRQHVKAFHSLSAHAKMLGVPLADDE